LAKSFAGVQMTLLPPMAFHSICSIAF